MKNTASSLGHADPGPLFTTYSLFIDSADWAAADWIESARGFLDY